MSVETQVVLGGAVIALGALLFIVWAERHAAGDGQRGGEWMGLTVMLAGVVVIVHGMFR